MYEILLEASSEKDLKKLPDIDFKKVVIHLNALAYDPKPRGCRKITGSKRDWRIRVGDYRIIYELDEKEKTIRVMRVKHRREAYR